MSDVHTSGDELREEQPATDPNAADAAPVRTKPRINRQRGAACACDEGARPAMRFGTDEAPAAR